MMEVHVIQIDLTPLILMNFQKDSLDAEVVPGLPSLLLFLPFCCFLPFFLPYLFPSPLHSLSSPSSLSYYVILLPHTAAAAAVEVSTHTANPHTRTHALTRVREQRGRGNLDGSQTAFWLAGAPTLVQPLASVAGGMDSLLLGETASRSCSGSADYCSPVWITARIALFVMRGSDGSQEGRW